MKKSKKFVLSIEEFQRIISKCMKAANKVYKEEIKKKKKR